LHVFLILCVCASIAQDTNKTISVLRSFFQATGGEHWTNSSGWSDPLNSNYCSWSGITCQNSTIDVYLKANNLTGQIPGNFTELNLRKVHLDQNNLNGNLDWFLPSEDLISLSLSHNQFEGEITLNLYKATKLRHLNLANNFLSGSLNASVSLWAVLERLDLSQNRFQGPLHQDISKVTFLYHLNISHNKFSGELPSNMLSLSLESVWASNNLFHKIDYTSDFTKVPADCHFEENPLICPMPGWAKNNCHANCNAMWSPGAITMTIVAGLFLIFSVAYIIWFFITMKKANDSYVKI